MDHLNSQFNHGQLGAVDTVQSLVEAYSGGSDNPRNVTERYLQRVEIEQFNAYISVTSEHARKQAKAATSRYEQGKPLSKLDGIPICLKDMIPTKGILTTAGSSILEDYTPDDDAPIVSMLNSKGAIILGKNNMHEYAYGVTSDNRTFGRVVNSSDRQSLPGGSSGGTASAVAAGLAVAGIGSDTGGSIRIPAACCNLVGLKPTYGLLPTKDCIPQAWSLDHLGPITHSIDDSRIILEALTVNHPRLLPSQDFSLEGLKIGIPEDLLVYSAPPIRHHFSLVLERLVAHGVQLQYFEYSQWQLAQQAWLTIMLAESANYHRANLTHRANLIDPGILPFLVAGSQLDAGLYLDAQRYRGQWTRQLSHQLEDVVAILNPCLPCEIPSINTEKVTTGHGKVSLRDALVAYQWSANLTGWPSLSFPVSVQEQASFSLMLTMQPFQDLNLLALADKIDLSLCA